MSDLRITSDIGRHIESTVFTQEPEGKDATRFTAKRIIDGTPYQIQCVLHGTTNLPTRTRKEMLSDLDLFERKKQQMTYSPI